MWLHQNKRTQITQMIFINIQQLVEFVFYVTILRLAYQENLLQMCNLRSKKIFLTGSVVVNLFV